MATELCHRQWPWPTFKVISVILFLLSQLIERTVIWWWARLVSDSKVYCWFSYVNVTFCFQWRRHSEYVGYQNGEHIEYIFKHFILYNWLYKMKSIDVLGSKHSGSVPKITEISGNVLCLWAYREWKWSPFRATWAHWSALILVRVVLSHAPANTASRTPANTARPRIRR